MLAKKGMIMELENNGKYLVDEVHNIKGVDFVVLFSLERNTFHIAQEIIKNNKPTYNFLDNENSLKIATLIDNIQNKD